MSNLGYKFEADEVDHWRKMFPCVNENFIFRVIMSGCAKGATKTGAQSMLEGDVSVELKKAGILHKDLLIECKHHKSRTIQKSFSIKKEWADQALHEATGNNRLSVVAIKFKGVRPNHSSLRKYCWYDGHFGNSVHYVMPQHQFIEILKYIEELKSSKTPVDLSQVSTGVLLDELKKRSS